MSYAVPVTENRGQNASGEERVHGEGKITDLLDALDDPDCRAVLEATGERPLSAKEIVERCEIPTSTAYRKIERLVELDLLREGIRVRSTGNHAKEYSRRVEQVALSIDDGGTEVRIVERDAAPAP
ncbi:hypothetical protein JCM30237_21730 [Halolamina litorea]|uniref:Helix-turn-helix domain-containing protein n=1 Tax=Halolamina litorea TaxID=1515593 RepID=A0ABD6BNM9_9EURY|nr:helix-turn-helix domain-containing protein [Halolamina litorea]